MEYSRPLSRFLATSDGFCLPFSPLRVKFAFEMGIQILSGLKVLHEKGFVHCGITPNIIKVNEETNKTLR